MKQSIQQLKQLGFNLQYPSLAVDHLHDTTKGWSRESFVRQIDQLIHSDGAIESRLQTLDFHQTKYTLFYLVQNLLQTNKDGVQTDYVELIETSITKAKQLCAQHHTVIYEGDEPLTNDGTQRSTARSGTKRERAYHLFSQLSQQLESSSKQFKHAVIAALIDQLDMTKSGATTYFYMCKKQHSQVE